MQLKPSSDSVSLRLLTYRLLTLLHIVTRWPVLQKVRGHPALNFINKLPFIFSQLYISLSTKLSAGLPLLIGMGFQVLFHSPPGVLFTFPSRYSSLSVTR